MTDLLTITEEPVGSVYLALLAFAVGQRSLFSLVWNDQLQFTPAAAAIASELESQLVSETRGGEWPGTKLLGPSATIRVYRLNASSSSTLAKAPGLFAWRSPDRPEDLALYTSDGSPWLGSIAHEADAFMYAGAIDIEELRRQVPDLQVEYAPRDGAR